MNIENHPLLKAHPHKIPASIANNDPPMMAVIAKLTAKPGMADHLKEVLAIACSLVHPNEPGIPQYHATQSREDPHIFKMFEVYRDQAALDHHTSGTPYIEQLLPMIINSLAVDPELEWLDSIFD